MAFLEDPRLRQRWNQITHDAETVTENAAAGIFRFSHNYVNPCFSSIAHAIEQCTTVCLGDPEDRLRRRRERQRARDNTEFTFDFYDDWYQEEQSGGILGSWGGEDWDRLLAGTGAAKKHGGAETTEQPRRKRGMSYGTRGARRKSSTVEDPTIIPSTQPIGFLSKLPWKMGGTLRYKPSAADLQEHPGKHDGRGGESAPLLGDGGGEEDEDDSKSESDYGQVLHMPRQRSATTGSGGTSDSYRSRGDLLPSDGEGEEDAVPLDDDVTYEMIKRDDGSSGKTRSSKGKLPAYPSAGSRTVSRSTLGSTASADSLGYERIPSSKSNSQPQTLNMAEIPSIPADKVTELKPDVEVQVSKVHPPTSLPQQGERMPFARGNDDDGDGDGDGDGDAESWRGEINEPSGGQKDYIGDGLEMTSSSAVSDAVPSFHAARLPRFFE